MKCGKCGRQLVVGARFCMMCGTKVAKLCSKCGVELPDAARFCFNCGTEVNSMAAMKTVNNTQAAAKQTILNENNMKQLSQIKAQVEATPIKDMPVWDTTASGSKCDCAVGECDCDGSIWS